MRSIAKFKRTFSGASARKSSVQIVHGGADRFGKDFAALKRAARRKGTALWACGKHTQAGDILLIYFQRPDSAILAMATAFNDARSGSSWRYVTELEDVKLLSAPIGFSELRKMFPRWPWLKQPRSNLYLDKQKADALLKRVALKLKAPPLSVNGSGGGFGTPEQNRMVERAACRMAKAHFRKRGYRVVSREKENLGYDFDVTRSEKTLHVEVKGVSGTKLGFPITCNEVNCARSDNLFHLAAVTEARSKKPLIHIFSAKQFLKRFKLTELAYYANCS